MFIYFTFLYDSVQFKFIRQLFTATILQDFHKSEYVSLTVVKEQLETQDRLYRTTLQIFVEDIKQELRTIRKDFEELKVSLQLGEIQDLKKNSTDAKLYGEQLKFIETNIEDTYDLERRCDG